MKLTTKAKEQLQRNSDEGLRTAADYCEKIGDKITFVSDLSVYDIESLLLFCTEDGDQEALEMRLKAAEITAYLKKHIFEPNK